MVARLREQWGHRTFPPGLTTRAQVVKALVDEANLKERLNPPIKVVSPSQYTIQPIAESTEEQKAALTPIGKQNNSKKENRSRGVSAAAEIQIKSTTPTAQQLSDVNTALEVANNLNAGEVATLAMFCAGIGESDFDRNSTNASGHMGIWQSDVIPGKEVSKQAQFFLKGGESFQAGGAIQARTRREGSRAISPPKLRHPENPGELLLCLQRFRSDH